MNYPPARIWLKVEPTIEQSIQTEPELITVASDLRLPAGWTAERRLAFLARWQRARA